MTAPPATGTPAPLTPPEQAQVMRAIDLYLRAAYDEPPVTGAGTNCCRTGAAGTTIPNTRLYAVLVSLGRSRPVQVRVRVDGELVYDGRSLLVAVQSGPRTGGSFLFAPGARNDDGVFDGTGRWIPLCSDTESFVPGMSVADVLLFTRNAADKVGPTKMDRPEDVEPNPVNGKVYVALTNNSNRGKAGMEADEANPVTSSKVRASPAAPLTDASGNRNGYVLELTERNDDHIARTFTWNLFLVCGDPEAPEWEWFEKDHAQQPALTVTFTAQRNAGEATLFSM